MKITTSFLSAIIAIAASSQCIAQFDEGDDPVSQPVEPVTQPVVPQPEMPVQPAADSGNQRRSWQRDQS